MNIPLQIATLVPHIYERSLRRFVFSDVAKCSDGWCHNAVTVLGRISSMDPGIVWHYDRQEPQPVHGDHWPHDDPRWPKTCERCGYEFTEADQWQCNVERIVRLPNGHEFTFRGPFGRCAPPGTALKASWWERFSMHPQRTEVWIISLPDGGEWVTSMAASGYWNVTGTMPNITVTPSIFHNSPTGWHGFITNGELVTV